MQVCEVHITVKVSSFLTDFRYKEIQDVEVRYLCDHYTDPGVTSAMPGMIVKLVNGELSHSGSVMTALLCQELKPVSALLQGSSADELPEAGERRTAKKYASSKSSKA